MTSFGGCFHFPAWRGEKCSPDTAQSCTCTGWGTWSDQQSLQGNWTTSNPTFKGPFQPIQFYHSMKSSHTCAPFPHNPCTSPHHPEQNQTSAKQIMPSLLYRSGLQLLNLGFKKKVSDLRSPSIPSGFSFQIHYDNFKWHHLMLFLS